MKTFIVSMVLCFFLPISEKLAPEPEEGKGDFLTKFEEGFKYSIDNLAALSNSTVPEIVDEAIRASGQKGTVTITNVNELATSIENSEKHIPFSPCFLAFASNVVITDSFEEFLVALAAYESCLNKSGFKSDSPEIVSVGLYRDAMFLLKDHLQYYKKGEFGDFEEVPGWWAAWGRCGAAIIGGTIAGGLSGGGLGWLTGGPAGSGIGAVLGGLAGSLNGAVKGC